MMPKSGARRLPRENAAGAATSTSHLVRPGSARMRTCARLGQTSILENVICYFINVGVLKNIGLFSCAPGGTAGLCSGSHRDVMRRPSLRTIKSDHGSMRWCLKDNQGESGVPTHSMRPFPSAGTFCMKGISSILLCASATKIAPPIRQGMRRYRQEQAGKLLRIEALATTLAAMHAAQGRGRQRARSLGTGGAARRRG